METLQGIEPKAVIGANWLRGEKEKMAALVAYVVTESNGMPIKVDTKHSEMMAFLFDPESPANKK
jgi:sulfur-oxidizing protein SoxA